MRALLLLLAALAALAAAQTSCTTDPKGSLCPNYYPSTPTATEPASITSTCAGAPTVQCLVDPCSIRPTESATCKPATCKASYCGSCTAEWFDANGGVTCATKTCDAAQCGPAPAIATVLCPDGKTTAGVGACVDKGFGCQWEITTCPVACPAALCTTACTLGYKKDLNGCTTCECNVAEVCPAVMCPDVSMADCAAKNGYLSNNGCCTVCVTPTIDCSLVDCAVPSCPVPAASEDTYVYTPPGECCPICDVVNCAIRAQCAQPLCEPGAELYVPPGQCCPTCGKPPACLDVACPAIACEPAVMDATTGSVLSLQTASVSDGNCCPTCDPLPDCSLVRCALPQCGPDQELVKNAGECCETCRDKDFCKRVLCPLPACPVGFQETRQGSCCPTCSYCRSVTEANSNGIVCTADGQPVCSPNVYGIDCNKPMPADQYVERCFEATVRASVAAWADLTTNTKCKYSVIAQLAEKLPALAERPENFACEVVSSDAEEVKVRLCVRVAKGDTSVNADATATQVADNLNAAPGVTKSSAAALAASLALVAAAALLAL